MMQLPDPTLPWPLPMPAVGMIAEAEQGPGGGVALKAYRCPAGVWTIGWGETENVHPGDACTKEEADKWLCDDLIGRSKSVQEMCKIEPSRNELGALTSLAYNIGLRDDKNKRGLYWSTVLRLHNLGKTQEAAQAFALFNKARDPATNELVVMNGLTARRAKEAALYLTPDDGEQIQITPQAVEKQPPIVASPTVGTSTAAIGIGSITAAFSSFKDFGSDVSNFVKDIAADLGLTPVQVLAGVMIIVGLIVLYRRWQQRQNGLA